MLFIDETKRSDLPDSEFGIPEDRKFPLDTAEHVHSAIKLFGHAEESKRKSLAKRIASKAKSYGIEIPETSQVYKYLHENSNMTADQVDAFYTELKKRLAEDDEVITESAILESSKNNYKKIYDITIKMFKDSGRLPNADNGELKQFLATGKTDEFGGALCIAGLGTGFEATCSKINKEIKPLGGRIYADNYGCAFLSIKENFIQESIRLPITLYHGSIELYSELKSTGIDLGNAFQDPGWSLFCWTKYDSAIGWAIFCLLRKLSEKYDLIIKGCINSQTANITISSYNKLKNILHNINNNEKTYYIYTIKPDKKYEYGLGHSSNTPNCITIRNCSIKPYKIDERILTIDDINNYCNIISDDYIPDSKNIGVDARMLSFLMTNDYMRNMKVKKQLSNDIANGKLVVGDDILLYMKNNNININKVSIFDRIKHEYALENNNDNDLDLPDGVQDDATSLVELLDSVDPKHIYLSSDWHISKNHYTHEKNAVNTSEIVSWCKEHIKDDDIFMYLGDMTYRWANDEDKENAKKIFKSLPGIKILIIGNHDEFSDGGNYEEYGFKYAVKELYYKNIIFSHRPIDMCDKPGYLNIHGHKHHKDTDYHSMDGSANVNVYPSFHNNKPITLDCAIKHKDYYMRNNKRSDWNGMGESSLLIEESIDMIDNLLNKEDTKVDEWAMTSFNPVIGIQKPYVLKAVDNTGSCINSKLYALSPDVISDKYLVVDENSKLSIVDKSYFDNYCVEVYEYTGNELNVGKIKKAYDEGNIVAPNYIYETLSGKDLLSDDQIDFDENFTKVDLDLCKAKTESFQATLLSEWDQINDKLYSFPVLENTSIDLNTKCNDELKLMQDINGYYLENTLTHNRTKSVPTIDMITEVMINSTLQKYI